MNPITHKRTRRCQLALALLSFSFLFQGTLEAQQTTVLSPTKDARVRPNNGNDGTASYLEVMNKGEGNSGTRTTWIGFDLSQVTGTVQQADLRLFAKKVKGNTTHTIFEGTSNWQENQIVYVNANNPEVFLPEIASLNLTTSDAGTWVTYDLTDYVNALVASGATEVTFVIEASNNVYSQYRSREHSLSPELEVTTGGGGGGTNDVPVETVAELRDALDDASAGDVISIAPGTYAPSDWLEEFYASDNRKAYFLANANGTTSSPITLKASDPSNPPILKGLTNSNSRYLLWIRGNHWVIENLVLERGGKGLMLDESSDSLVSNVTVKNVGDEGIHLRSGSSRTVVQDCLVQGTGKSQPGFGEGVYIGSDGGQWNKYDEECDDNVIIRCDIKSTKAECIDVKEGTSGTVIRDCRCYGSQISGINHANSFIDLKGINARVFDNRFYKQQNETVTRGVAIVHRPNGPTADENWIYQNQYYMNNANGLMVHAYDGNNNFAWSNSRSPSGEEYQGNAPELYIFDPQ